MGRFVRRFVGWFVGRSVGRSVRRLVGDNVGLAVGNGLGNVGFLVISAGFFVGPGNVQHRFKIAISSHK